MDEYKQIWVIFYSSVVGWQYHPGRKCPLDLKECGEIADRMLKEYVWRFGPQPPQ